jgi:hypothetical protein
MYCPHCEQKVEKIFIYTNVVQRQEIEFVDDEPFLVSAVTYEIPNPITSYKFRCGNCRRDISKYRQRFMSLLKK